MGIKDVVQYNLSLPRPATATAGAGGREEETSCETLIGRCHQLIERPVRVNTLHTTILVHTIQAVQYLDKNSLPCLSCLTNRQDRRGRESMLTPTGVRVNFLGWRFSSATQVNTVNVYSYQDRR